MVSMSDITSERIEELKTLTGQTKMNEVISDAIKLFHSLEKYKSNGSEVILRFEGENTKVLF